MSTVDSSERDNEETLFVKEEQVMGNLPSSCQQTEAFRRKLLQHAVHAVWKISDNEPQQELCGAVVTPIPIPAENGSREQENAPKRCGELSA